MVLLVDGGGENLGSVGDAGDDGDWRVEAESFILYQGVRKEPMGEGREGYLP